LKQRFATKVNAGLLKIEMSAPEYNTGGDFNPAAFCSSCPAVRGGKACQTGVVAETATCRFALRRTNDVLARIDAIRKQAGTNSTLILKANIWITDIATARQVNDARDAWVVQGLRPCAPKLNPNSPGQFLTLEKWSKRRSEAVTL
jgi:hypothetical protein